MSLHPQPTGPVPELTARVAHAVFPQGNRWLRLRDEFGPIFNDAAFAPLFPRRGQPAEAPWRLALITLLQYAENLSDREAAHAVRSRIDWKYLLGLDLMDPGFDYSVLSEFRSRLVAGGAEEQLLDLLLSLCRERQLLQGQGRQRTDSTHVLAKVRALNRLGCVGETLRAALNTLAVAHPRWLRLYCPMEWLERYGTRMDEYRLPSAETERRAYAEQIGRDGHALLEALASAGAPSGLPELPAVESLRRVWIQQFYVEEGAVRWRSAAEGLPPSSLFISSPYDAEARYACKRTTSWVGYKVHLTESCDDERPHLITHVETTAAPVADGSAIEPIHQALEARELLPRLHIVDTAYVDAELLLSSERAYGVDLLGPTLRDRRWQAKAAQGFAASDFVVDWERKKATCPAGKESIEWRAAVNHGTNHVIKIKFAITDCRRCAHRSACTRSNPPHRSLTVRPKEQYLALQAARARATGADFAAEYRRRAGIEGTISQGVRGMPLRRSRYIGHAKTHLQHIGTAAAINLVRIAAWLAGEDPETTRQSAFMRLMAPPMAA
jgi:transposase